MQKNTVDLFREYQQKGLGPIQAYLTKRARKMKQARLPKYKELEAMLYNLKRESVRLNAALAEKDRKIEALEKKGI